MATLKEQYNNKEGFYSNNALIANAVHNTFGSVDVDYVLEQFAPNFIDGFCNQSEIDEVYRKYKVAKQEMAELDEEIQRLEAEIKANDEMIADMVARI